ncbi:MAG: ABC transporter [Clostridiales bacterium GWF2_38_85]|nr:MAG: ABC transporter [Clostridiales bacterium GWF2_38_85]
MIEIKSLTKKYGKKIAVDNLSLNIEAGDIYGFIGHNGAGKTTTIKSITGVIPFDEGEILIDGISIVKDSIAAKKLFAYIPDSPDLYPSMTGIKFINFICDIYEIGSKERQENIKKYSDLFEMTSVLGSPISSYSHGMKQKLAIISALSHDPKLLILDEPFVGLDPKASYTLKEIMHELCNKGGAVFFSTHVLEVAEKLCNKIAIIKNGKLVRTGATSEVIGDNSLEHIFLELIKE